MQDQKRRKHCMAPALSGQPCVSPQRRDWLTARQTSSELVGPSLLIRALWHQGFLVSSSTQKMQFHVDLCSCKIKLLLLKCWLCVRSEAWLSAQHAAALSVRQKGKAIRMCGS